MVMKRTLLLVLLLILPALLYSAVYHSVTVTAFPYFAIPHFEDAIPIRTASGAALSVGLFGLTTDPVDFSVEMHYRGIVPSIPHGHYRMRGFHSLGATLRFSTPLNDSLTLFGATGTEIHTYFEIKESFASFSAEVGLALLLEERPQSRLEATFPIAVHLRKEITALSVGVGLRYQLHPYRRKSR